MKKSGYVFIILASAVYLLNPGWGVFELLPDNLPIVGNIDEGAAGALILWAIGQLRSLSKVNGSQDRKG
jgi:uncharacterized membrane protein YkvA (DUF1232 family)